MVPVPRQPREAFLNFLRAAREQDNELTSSADVETADTESMSRYQRRRQERKAQQGQGARAASKEEKASLEPQAVYMLVSFSRIRAMVTGRVIQYHYHDSLSLSLIVASRVTRTYTGMDASKIFRGLSTCSRRQWTTRTHALSPLVFWDTLNCMDWDGYRVLDRARPPITPPRWSVCSRQHPKTRAMLCTWSVGVIRPVLTMF